MTPFVSGGKRGFSPESGERPADGFWQQLGCHSTTNSAFDILPAIPQVVPADSTEVIGMSLKSVTEIFLGSLEHLPAVLFASAITLLATFSARYFRDLRRTRKLGAILGFAKKQITFVYPARVDKFSEPARNILPRTSTEDFLAMNNIMSALLQIQWSGEAKLKIASDFHEEDRAKDLILICSPVSNPVAEMTLKELYQTHPSLPTFEREQASNRYYIRAGTDYFYSNTYDVVEHCIANGQRPEEAEMVDYGVIVKAPNPWDSSNTVLMVAGIRGVGTWGAAEFLKKQWQVITDKKRHDGQHHRSGPFAAIVEVKLARGDLVGFKLMRFWDLD